MPFVKHVVLGPLPPLVLNNPFPQMGSGLGYWVFVLYPFSLFGGTWMIY